jgi:hypothetical protein
MSARQKRPDPEPKPSLRISHIVYGRRSRGNRVEYLVDDVEDRYEIPEKVVMIRWRRRKHSTYSFSGDRLGPHLWRALAAVLGKDCSQWPKRMTEEHLNATRDSWKANETCKEYFNSLPALATIEALWEICGPVKLQKLVDRHADPKVFGVPDLFLFARHKTSAKKLMGRFVEVKKPEEALSEGQREEIAFMNEIGLHARCIRLMEREG